MFDVEPLLLLLKCFSICLDYMLKVDPEDSQLKELRSKASREMVRRAWLS